MCHLSITSLCPYYKTRETDDSPNYILEMLVEKMALWYDVVTMPTETYLESEEFRGDTGYRPLVGMVKAREI